MLVIREITNSKKDKRRFFKFPVELYKDCPYFVPSLYMDEKSEFDPKQNGAFAYAECKMWLAERDGKVVGRAAGVLNKAYNQKMNVKQMRFTRFDFVDDAEVVDALFEKYPAGAVSVYLHMFQNQTEEGWPELQDILDNDERVTIK